MSTNHWQTGVSFLFACPYTLYVYKNVYVYESLCVVQTNLKLSFFSFHLLSAVIAYAHCLATIPIFETGSHCVALAVLELARVDRAGLKLTEIHLLLLPKCWD